MTAQANTAGQADAATPTPDPKTGTTAEGQANPQTQANPEAAGSKGDLEKQIATAEKRIEDKQAYLEKLENDLRDHDRKINEHKQKLKMLSAQRPPEPPREQIRQETPTLTETQHDAAKTLGLSGEQFISLLRDDPDKALAAIVNVTRQQAEQDILGKLPLHMERYRIERELLEKVEQIRSSMSEADYQLFVNAAANYSQHGYSPTPEHLLNEVRFGTPEQQRQLMEYGLAVLQRQQQEKASGETTAQPQGAPPNRNARPFPMAPGGANPITPQQGNRDRRGNNILAGLGWNT